MGAIRIDRGLPVSLIVGCRIGDAGLPGGLIRTGRGLTAGLIAAHALLPLFLVRRRCRLSALGRLRPVSTAGSAETTAAAFTAGETTGLTPPKTSAPGGSLPGKTTAAPSAATLRQRVRSLNNQEQTREQRGNNPPATIMFGDHL
jgi:hypothetical protein